MTEQSGAPLAQIKPARIAQEVKKLSGQRRSGEIRSDEYDQRFARMIQELRERRVDGSRAEITAAMKPLVDAGEITVAEHDRLLKQLGMSPPLHPLRMTVSAGDGLLLKGTLIYPQTPVGRSYPLAVLAHQYPATSDSYAPLLDDLLELEIAVVAFDERGHGASTAGRSGPVVIDTPVGFTPEAFGAAFMGSASRVGFNRIDDDILRVASWGAAQNFIDQKRLLLIGASVGGTGVVLAAPKVPGLAALLTFGAAGELVWGADGREQGRRAIASLTAPCLLTSSAGDAFAGAANVKAWSEGFKHVTTKIVPGDAHAMAIYYEVRADVLAFLKRVGHA